ncbi:MAG TPA: OmpA family protein [Flavobacterium sp.]|uniref:OmpA family protein n=1 Tax=Flavobacterium sp. TaxID=239 RepID=UPI002C9A8BB5|nr:OmpA family protein [Flavobacterium sp.]HNP33889.1 OmpA family protein [Flavobacterium sp.]
MKHKISVSLTVFCFLFFNTIQSQEKKSGEKYFQISPRIGIDFPTYDNNTPFINYKSGLEFGISVDHYWNWFGLGADFDYIKNSPESSYATKNLINSGAVPLTSFALIEDNITRMFYGIGPDYRYSSKSKRFVIELNTRAGLGSVKGGKTQLNETTTADNQLLNYHAGYDDKNIFSVKGQVRFTYFFKPNFGLQIGAYYLRHFDAVENVDTNLGFAAAYQSVEINPTTNENVLTADNINKREDACHCDISSVGVFVGLSLKIPTAKTIKQDDCIQHGLTITAKDKFTKEILPDTDVVIKNAKGEIIKSGKTNSFGAVVFENVVPDDYTIEGLLNSVKLEPTLAKKSEFKPNKTIQKEIIYSDLNLILKGTAVVCNTKKPISNVIVTLKNQAGTEEKTTVTDSLGQFTFPIQPKSKYLIYGKKENYFSQTETVTSEEYDRNVTLFVKVKLCLEEADCGKAITLKNILYDLDKYFIREESKKELNRLVQFMVDNPGVKVEVSSHTDSRASFEYNQVLSQNRANAAVDYLVSQGIDRSRLKGVGYGETKLLNECADGVNCTEEQHQLNRRTEMKVICPEKKNN